jgi:serine/threonine protein phosphatase PrpC
MILDTAQITGIGDRPSNQDALATASEDGLSCFILADGTGGHEGGEVAASLVIEGIAQKFLQEASFSARALRSYIDWAILKVADFKKQNAKYSDMSATVASILIDQNNHCALWAHLGDTRIYMFRHGRIIHMSKDHSMAQRLVDAGYANYATIRKHPQRNMLYAAIGAEGDTAAEITQEAVELQNGDAFLLCTDGFWEWISEDEMEQSLHLAVNSEAWLNAMNALAEKNIAASAVRRDNFSAITICLQRATTAATTATTISTPATPVAVSSPTAS